MKKKISIEKQKSDVYKEKLLEINEKFVQVKQTLRTLALAEKEAKCTENIE